jgi:hypothetical protein
MAGYRESDLVKLDMLINGDPIDAFSVIIHRDKAQEYGRKVAEKLKETKASFEKSTKLFAKPASPRPFPPLPPLAGKFVNPSLGEAAVAPDRDALVMELQATGAKFKLVPWDGDIFIASLMPTGRFGAIVASSDATIGFVQFQMDKEGKLNLLRLSREDGQAYEFRRK